MGRRRRADRAVGRGPVILNAVGKVGVIITLGLTGKPPLLQIKGVFLFQRCSQQHQVSTITSGATGKSGVPVQVRTKTDQSPINIPVDPYKPDPPTSLSFTL